MGFLDITVYILIALSFNLFIHNIIAAMYKELPYDQKLEKTIQFLVLSGICTIVISRMIDKSVVSTGLLISGLILILASFVADWDSISDELKLITTGGIFVGIIYYFHKYYKKEPANADDA